jgi:hypothetical protein
MIWSAAWTLQLLQELPQLILKPAHFLLVLVSEGVGMSLLIISSDTH